MLFQAQKAVLSKENRRLHKRYITERNSPDPLKNRDFQQGHQKNKNDKSYTKPVALEQPVTLFQREARKKSWQMSLKVTPM